MENRMGEVLTGLRKEKKLSQKEIAEKMNISQRAYAHYEKGDREPSIETMIRLADYYKVSLDYLTGRYKTTTEINK